IYPADFRPMDLVSQHEAFDFDRCGIADPPEIFEHIAPVIIPAEPKIEGTAFSGADTAMPRAHEVRQYVPVPVKAFELDIFKVTCGDEDRPFSYLHVFFQLCPPAPI